MAGNQIVFDLQVGSYKEVDLFFEIHNNTGDWMKRSSFPTCFDCEHFRGAKVGTCDAFPEHIPEQIWLGKFHHDKAFPGDRGFRFQPGDAIEFLSVDELAKLLNINPKTIYRALWSKSLPAYKFGRTWRIARRDIEHFRK